MRWVPQAAGSAQEGGCWWRAGCHDATLGVVAPSIAPAPATCPRRDQTSLVSVPGCCTLAAPPVVSRPAIYPGSCLWGRRRFFSKSGDVWCDVTSGLMPAVSAPPATEFATPACSGGWRATVRHKVRLDCTSGFGRAMPHHLAPACFSRCCSVHSRRSPLPTCLPVCLLACLFALPCSGGGCLFGGLGLVCAWAIGPSPVVA